MKSLLVVVLLSGCGTLLGLDSFTKGDGNGGGAGASDMPVSSSSGPASSTTGGGGPGGRASTAAGAAGGTGGAGGAGGGGEAALWVFVSSQPVDPSIGTSALHQMCNDLALAGSAVTIGTYVAWISDDSVDALDGLAASAGPWHRPGDQQLVFASRADIEMGMRPLATIDTDENGNEAVGGELVFTGSDAMGGSTDGHCSSWSQNDGDDFATMGFRNNVTVWTDDLGFYPCSTPGRIYCFEVR